MGDEESKVDRVASILLADAGRQGGRLTLDQFLRIVEKRALTTEEQIKVRNLFRMQTLLSTFQRSRNSTTKSRFPSRMTHLER